MELIGWVNEAGIFVGDRGTAFYHYSGVLQTTWVWYAPCETNVTFRGDGRILSSIPGYIEATVRIPPIKDYDKCVPMFVLNSSSPLNLRVPVQLGTTLLVRAMAKITVVELVHVSSMWQQTYMSTMVLVGVAGIVDQKWWHLLHWCPLVMTKPTVIPLWMPVSKGVDGVRTGLQSPSTGYHGTNSKSMGNKGLWLLALIGISALALDGWEWYYIICLLGRFGFLLRL